MKKIIGFSILMLSSVAVLAQDSSDYINRFAPAVNIKISPSIFGDRQNNEPIRSEVIKPAQPAIPTEVKADKQEVKKEESKVQDVGYAKSIAEKSVIKADTGLKTFNKDTISYYNELGWKEEQEKLKKVMKNSHKID